MRRLLGPGARYMVPLAVNRFGFNTGCFFLDLRTGDLRCLAPGFEADRLPLAHPAASAAAASPAAGSARGGGGGGGSGGGGEPNSSGGPSGGGAVRWLEALAARVTNGTYAAAPIRPDDPRTLGLCLFPLRQPRGDYTEGDDSDDDAAYDDAADGAAGVGPAAAALLPPPPPSVRHGGGGGGEERLVSTVAVTRGVECRASVLYMTFSEQWTYSIRVRLLEPGEAGYLDAAARGFETCQLKGRHWAIDGPPGAGPTEHVRGEGVVGSFPLLREGGSWDHKQVSSSTHPRSLLRDPGGWRPGPFVYQSCSGRMAPGGSFGGELIFVPGSLLEPTGAPFEAAVARFALDLPDFFF